MFDNLKNMAGLAGLMKDIPRIRAKLEEVKERLELIEVNAETGGGAVHATANCKMRIVSIKLDQALLGSLLDAGDETDQALAEELITGAINAALEKAQARAQEEFAAAAGDLGLNLPPGMLEGLA
ncbi:MAG: YbaB/EbfC family nucleoid-associated protein [Phycisphaerales bacterium]